jgi:hypothetical protein
MMKFRKTLFAVACVASIGYAHADEPKSYVGLQYKRPVPENRSFEIQRLKDEASTELPKECKSSRYFEKLSPTHRYGMTSVTCNGQTLGWLEEFIGPVANDPKMIEVKIVDQVSIRARQGYERFSSNIGRAEVGCYLKAGKKKNPVVVMGLYQAESDPKTGALSEYMTVKKGGLRELWIANPATRKIERPSKEWEKSVVCEISPGDV